MIKNLGVYRMGSLNKVQLIGNIGKDPELRHTQSNTPYCKFSLATTEKIKDKEDKTSWHNITIWGKQAEVANRYLQKGKQVYLEGRLEYGSYEDRQGVKRYTTEIVVNNFVFLGGKSGQQKMQSTERVPETDQFTDEDIPF